MSSSGAGRIIDAQSPLLLRVVVPGTALLASAGFVLAWVLDPEVTWLLAAAGVVLIAGIVSIWRGRLGAWALVVTGTMLTALLMFILAFGGGVPWALVAFWASSAALLAGLLCVLEPKGEQARMANVTVLAVLSLLAMSAIALGLYVRVEWSAAEKAVLEDAPLWEYDPGERYTGALDLKTEAAPGGRWARYWRDRGRGARSAMREIRSGLTSDGWRVVRTDSEGLVAENGRYRLVVIYEELESEPVGTSGISRKPNEVPVLQMAAYVGER